MSGASFPWTFPQAFELHTPTGTVHEAATSVRGQTEAVNRDP